MADKRRRARRTGSTSGATEAAAHGHAASAPRPQPEWKWFTVPVLFAFALGGFLGVYAGMAVQASESDGAFLVVTSVFAVLLGAALSRMAVRWMVGHQWVKPKKR